MNSKLCIEELGKFNIAVNIDYGKLSKKTDKFRLDVDVKKVKTYANLKHFLDIYNNYLSFLGKTQFEMILKNAEWSKTVYTILAVNRFKNLIKT